MPSIQLIDAEIPEFGVPQTRPELSPKIYAARLAEFRTRTKEAGLDAVVIYADREHFANLAYLTGFDPRFEEAIMVVIDGRDPLILTGPENQGTAAASAIDIDVQLFPPFGLLGQARKKTKPLCDLLRAGGIAKGAKVGTIGWKYFGPLEAQDHSHWIEIPSFIVDTLRSVVGEGGDVINATSILMDASRGLRSASEIDQIAQFEFSAVQVSEAVKAVLFGIKPGMREFDVASLMRPIGLPLAAHPMLSTGDRAYLGLLSPSDRPIERASEITVALGIWGALTARAGWVAESELDLPSDARDYVERLVAPYFACAVEWYETIGIGVKGGDIDAITKKHLGDSFFNVLLNPGHLIHLDEWMNTPVYPGSSEVFRSGQTVQLDIIPAPGSPYFTSNIEDGIALLDDAGRGELAERWPELWRRVQARRAFMSDVLGIHLKPEVLPLSNLQGYLAPFFLSPRRVLARR